MLFHLQSGICLMDHAQQRTADEDWIDRAKALAPLIESLAPRIESERALPAELLAALHERQLFRMLLPQSLGGGEIEPACFIQALEALAMADGSTAWCVGQASAARSVPPIWHPDRRATSSPRPIR